jgi:hypothetical protein
MSEIQRFAKREHLTLGEWVRRALREARANRPTIDAETKLKAVRHAARYSFPTPEDRPMLNQIESGYEK